MYNNLTVVIIYNYLTNSKYLH